MADQKQKIHVRVGKPVQEKNRYGAGNTIMITNTVSIDPEQSLNGLVERLTELQNKYSCDYENLNFESVHDCGCYYDCNCSPSYILRGKRLETDLELKFRLETEAQRKEMQRVRDEKELEAIAKRLGKTVV